MIESKTFNRVATIILSILVVIALLPIVLIVIASFTEETTLLRDGYSFSGSIEYGCLLLYGKAGSGNCARLRYFFLRHHHWYGRKCGDHDDACLPDVQKIF